MSLGIIWLSRAWYFTNEGHIIPFDSAAWGYCYGYAFVNLRCTDHGFHLAGNYHQPCCRMKNGRPDRLRYKGISNSIKLALPIMYIDSSS